MKKSIITILTIFLCAFNVQLSSAIGSRSTLKLSLATLSSAKGMLQEVMPSLLELGRHPDIARVHFSTTKYIFEHTRFGEYIFKLKKNPLPREIERKKALLEKARGVIHDNDLKSLIIPRSHGSYWLDHEKKEWAVFIEEKIPLAHNQEIQQYVNNEKMVEELTVFICKTAFSDIHYGNIPLTLSEKHLALCDLELEVDDNDSIAFYTQIFVGIANLLLCMPDELHTIIINTVQKTLKLWPKTVLNELIKALKSPSFPQLSLASMRQKLDRAIRKERPKYHLKLLGLKGVGLAHQLLNTKLIRKVF